MIVCCPGCRTVVLPGEKMLRKMKKTILLIVLVLCASCSTQNKLSKLRSGSAEVDLSVGKELPVPKTLSDTVAARDTLTVSGEDGRELFILKAVRDEDGEMVATDVIDAAVVSARFSNVAEREGKVRLSFRIRVPAAMRDSRWQLRFYPRLCLLGDTLELDKLIITGPSYRKAQLRGYQQYENFLSRIIPDTASFLRRRELEIFLKRNIPDFYAFRQDSSFVSDSQVLGAFGVSGEEAVQHYTDHFSKWWNDRRKKMSDRVFRRYVKSPMLKDGVRLDTVLQDSGEDFIYDYLQIVDARPGLRKAEVLLSGEILETGKRIYSIPDCEPVVFYISSLSSLRENRERFLLKVIERRVELNTACYVVFETGSSRVDETLGDNAAEIGRIKENLAEVSAFEGFELDSVVVRASASPEGESRANQRLSELRGRSISEYLDNYLDSLRRSEIRISLAPADSAGACDLPPFISRSDGENWAMLDRLVSADTLLTETEKGEYLAIRETPDCDQRERKLSRTPFYRYLREHLYPRLRTVRFDFHLHRKDMAKDTIVTTVPDTLYRRGVQLLQDGDYRGALEILLPYSDFNTALCFAGLERNASALAVLEGLKPTPSSEYLKALLYSRTGELEKAVVCYVNACSQDPAYIHRGNLDPEISALLTQYELPLSEYY